MYKAEEEEKNNKKDSEEHWERDYGVFEFKERIVQPFHEMLINRIRKTSKKYKKKYTRKHMVKPADYYFFVYIQTPYSNK